MNFENVGKGITIDVEKLGLNFDAFDSASDSENEHENTRKKKLKMLRKSKVGCSENVRTQFYVGQVFGTSLEVKELVRILAVETRRDLKMVKNDNMRVRVRCFGSIPCYNGDKGETSNEMGHAEVVSRKKKRRKRSVAVNNKGKGKIDKKVKQIRTPLPKPTCPWTLHVSRGVDEDSWMVKTFIEDHKCLQTRELKCCNSTFLSRHIGDTIASNPDIPGKALQDQLTKKFELGIKRMTAYRAKDKAKKRLNGGFSRTILTA